MSEQKTETKKVPSIPVKEKVKIEVSGAFHGRILGVYYNLVSKYDLKELTKLYKAIQDNAIEDLETEQDQINATALETLMVLIKGIELAFKNEGKIVEEKVDVPISED